MKKPFLILFIIATLVCALAISVSAAEFGAIEEVEGMSAKSVLDTTSRVLLFDGTDYHTYPTYYILSNNAVVTFDFKELNTKDESDFEYSKNSIVMIEYPEGVTNAGSLGSATLLEYVKFSDSVTTIGSDAFKKCSKLKDVAFSYAGNLTKISQAAFEECPAIEEINMPNSVTTLGINVFIRCTSLNKVTLSTGLTSIGINMFNGCSALESIELPAGITGILSNGFANCTKLKSITLPVGVETLGDGAFSKCTALTSINFPTTLETIGKQCFDGCTGFTVDAILPEGLSSIGYRAFFQSSFTSVTVPSTVTSIGDQSFSQAKVSSATVKCATLGANMFLSCKSLSAITLENTSVIQNRAFKDCTTLTEIVIPNGTVQIDDYAFYGCSGLTKVYVPNSVITMGTSIFESAFDKNADNEAIVDTNQICNGMFISSNLKEITLNNTQSIGANAFKNCKLLSAPVVLPCTLTSIGSGAFTSCHTLAEITIPGSVTTIPTDIFSYCRALTTVNYLGENLAAIQAAVAGSPEAKAPVYVKVNYCVVYNGGNHTMEGKLDARDDDYFKAIVVASVCSVCGIEDSVVEEIAPIFEWKGYSACTYGDVYSITQGYKINKTSIEKYEKYVPNFDFGILATVNFDGKAFSPSLEESSVAKFNNVVNDYIDIKVVGITESVITVKVVFCIYVSIGNELYYLDNGETASVVTGIAYNQALGQAKTETE